MFGYLRQRRRARIKREGIEAWWHDALLRGWPYYALLPSGHQEELRQHMAVLLAEKNFEGCGGLKLTGHMRMLIAAQASLPILKRPGGYYPGLRSILVYPEAFVVEDVESDDGVVLGEDVREGEAWDSGAIVLSWEDIERDMREFDGCNLIIHEFAHHLHFEDQATVGASWLKDAAQREAWAKVMNEHFARLRQEVAAGKESWLDEYAAEDALEFLAVLTEVFFECPHDVANEAPGLYAQLVDYYRQDPRTYFEES